MSKHQPPPAALLPKDLEVVAELSASPRHCVLRTRWQGQPAVTRVDRGTDRGQALAELAVLGGLSHASVANLLDYGTLPDGSVYVTREWIEGVPLDEWAAERAEELPAVLVKLCEGLDALHRAGVVHGDLKPSNILVQANGTPVLCDFGLSSTRDCGRAPAEARRVAGSLVFLAPELLGGAPASPATDLFALGVLLHALTVGGWPSVAEFYALFPRRGFLESVGSRPDDLPGWCREIGAALLARNVLDRPRSPGQVARSISAGAGLADSATGLDRAELHWSPSGARRGWLQERADEVAAPRTGSAPAWWLRLTRDEDAAELASALQLEAVLRSVAVRARAIEPESVVDLRAFDQWLSEAPTQGAHIILFAKRRDPAVERALAWSARRALEDAAVRSLSVICSGPPIAPELAWRERPVPATDIELLSAWLDAELDVPAGNAARDSFARALLTVSSGSSSTLSDLFAAASERRLFAAGATRPVLRADPVPDTEDLRGLLSGNGEAQFEPAAAQLLATLWLREAPGVPEQLADELETAPNTLRTALRELIAGGCVRVRSGGLVLTPRGSTRAASACEPSLQRELHARRGARSEEPLASAHALAAASAGVDEEQRACRTLVRQLEELRERGSPERVLVLVDRLEDHLAAQGRRVPAPLVAERAFAWLVLGRTGRADQIADALVRDGQTALAARVRGLRAMRAGEAESALRFFEQARSLDPACEGEVRVAEVSVLHAQGRHDEVVARVDELVKGTSGLASTSLGERELSALGSLAALSRFALGEGERARAELEQLCHAAEQRGDCLRAAALWSDRAHVERELGELGRAAEHLCRATELCDEHGLLASLATLRMDLAGVERERGHLLAAQELLQSAIRLRAGLGDTEGAALGRGRIGLVLADRGHVGAALNELRDALDGLGPHRRRRHAPLLESRAAELEARIGLEPRQLHPATRETRDPRVLVYRGRTAWLTGDEPGARGLLERGLQAALSTGARLVAAEARLALALLNAGSSACRSDLPEAECHGLPEDDRQLFDLLLARRDTFERGRMEALAERFEQTGRDDRAARAWSTLAARDGDPDRALRWQEKAELSFERCAAGLDEDECEHLAETLLGVREPRAEDLDSEPKGPDRIEIGLERLLQINHRLIEKLDLPSLLGAIVDSAIEVTGAQRGFLVLEEDGELRLDTALDSRRGDIREPLNELSRSILERAFAAGEPLRLSNAREHPSLASAPSVIDLDLRSVLCAPFAVGPGKRGAIYVDHRHETAAFSETSQRLIGLLAGQAALALQQLARLDSVRTSNRRLNERVASAEADLEFARRQLRDAGVGAPDHGLVGHSEIMRRTRTLLARAAPAEIPVLITGSSGTGKELAATALHAQSKRNTGPLVVENCAALPPSLVEAELFGHVTGAFTGADGDRPGLFERADGGTLFLDEVGELTLEAQAKLLRVLETREVRRLGASDARAVDFRLVTATNRDLGAEVAAGRFREDLYYRLTGLQIGMPTLADRSEDVPELVDCFLRDEAERAGHPQRQISREMLKRLTLRRWPGNVRELKSEIARLCVLHTGDLDDLTLLSDPLAVLGAAAETSVRSLADAEREAILAAVRHTGGNKVRAAELLGISRSKLYTKLESFREAG